MLSLKAFELSGITEMIDIPRLFNTGIGELGPGIYQPSRSNRIRHYESTDARAITGDPTKQDPENIFYGATVVFTGTLSSMTRGEAQQMVADIGGNVANSVTKQTDYLVFGHQDLKLVGEDGLSGKQEKAMKMKAGGHSIELMTETDFLRHFEVEISLAVKMTLRYSLPQNIPARYKNGSTTGTGAKVQDGVELRFNEEVKAWDETIQVMTAQLGQELSLRYLSCVPEVQSDCRSVAHCEDFRTMNKYLEQRRDHENCGDDELGLLTIVLTEMQRAIEAKLLVLGSA